MAISPLYIPAFSIEDVLLDKDTGAPLSGGLVYFEKDDQRGILKPVYQITGTSPNYTFTQLPNPMTLSSIGTFEDALGNPVVPYFFPYDAAGEVELYYIRVLSSGLVPQFDREAVPFLGNTAEPDVLSVITNELSNPQFVDVNFDTPSYTYNVNAVSNQVLNIAPDWDMIVTAAGAGSVTLTQLAPAGTLNIPTNPGTILTISSSGLTTLVLRQRLYGSPNLWSGGFLSATFVGKTYSGTTVPMTIWYSQSGGTVNNIAIASGSFPSSGNYIEIPGATDSIIPISNSPDTFPDAYIDIFFNLPVGIQIDLTSIMVAFTGESRIEDINYDQETESRQIDHLFHYFQPEINFKPIPSLLTAWDFPLNPAQFGSSGAMAGVWGYMWDQTLGARGTTGPVNYARDSVSSGIQFTTTGVGPDAWIMAQYLTGAEAKKMLGTTLSVNLNAYKSGAGLAINFKIYLFRGSSAAVVPTLGLAIGTLSSDGSFTLNGLAGQGQNWSYITRSNGGGITGVASGTLNVVASNDQINNDNDYGFNGWEITDPTQIADTDKFCIIVTFAYTSDATVVTVNSISVVPGDIPTRPAPQTVDEVFRESQYYYQTTFQIGATVPSAVTTGQLSAPMNATLTAGTNVDTYSNTFGNNWSSLMRTTPTVTLYSGVSTTANKVEVFLNTIGGSTTSSELTFGTFWSTLTANTKSFRALPAVSGGSLLSNNTAGNTNNSTAWIQYHYVADARLGKV